jgi:riboflavin kinase/FMN adenylyltransferase
MLHYGSLESLSLDGCFLTIGAFDGVHLGHQAILRQLVQGAHAAGLPAVVLTFHPHPAIVLRRRQGPFYLTIPEERAEIFGRLGVEIVVTHPFNHDVADQSANEFIARLERYLKPRHLLVGKDFALGKDRQGDLPALQRLGEQFGFTVDTLAPVRDDGQSISSSQIRVLLAEGEIERANQLLGRDYSVSGEIVHGDGRGRLLGIPTANLRLWPERLLPKVGVYACLARAEGALYQAVCNVGLRPTFENTPQALRLEAHLLDYQGDLYCQNVEIQFAARLRDEQRFATVDQLVAQIHHDIGRARSLLQEKLG